MTWEAGMAAISMGFTRPRPSSNATAGSLLDIGLCIILGTAWPRSALDWRRVMSVPACQPQVTFIGSLRFLFSHFVLVVLVERRQGTQ